MEEIRNSDELMKKCGMYNYVKGLGLWMFGIVYWHLLSRHYGIYVTTYLHVQSRDLLAHHQLDIMTNIESNHCVPFGVMMN